MAGTKIETQDGVVLGCQCTLCTGFRGYPGIGVGPGAEWASEKQRFPLGQATTRKETMTTELCDAPNRRPSSYLSADHSQVRRPHLKKIGVRAAYETLNPDVLKSLTLRSRNPESQDQQRSACLVRMIWVKDRHAQP